MTGQLTYGFCLTFEDRLQADLSSRVMAMRSASVRSQGHGVAQHGATDILVTRKSLCIVTQWPFAAFFKRCWARPL
jgi:hypothetical protein